MTKPTQTKAGDTFTHDLFLQLLEEEYAKLREAHDRDVHDDSKHTTLPIAREVVRAYVDRDHKIPWVIDPLNINLNNHDLEVAKRRIQDTFEALDQDGTRITKNLDFVAS